jgi:hypothetical protein
MFLLAEGQTGEAWKGSNKAMLCRKSEEFRTKTLLSSFYFRLKKVKCLGQVQAQFTGSGTSTVSVGAQKFFDFTYGNAIRATRTEYIDSGVSQTFWQLSFPFSLPISPYFHLVFCLKFIRREQIKHAPSNV